MHLADAGVLLRANAVPLGGQAALARALACSLPIMFRTIAKRCDGRWHAWYERNARTVIEEMA